ncbi:hypothetical protein HPB49_015580 [Dermacentor silvarum]|uniref:Uncharacterized protein n=1 Tax=Dermacentor silvarum TaxID=543639 RepID=A0ACB8E1K6_DERSI|nr:hypothetical protein HPB49_015580 [Dermacentor silvarum]
MAGVQGEVRLTPSDSSGVNITVRLVGPPGEFSWSVREMPALFDAASPCADLGRARHDLSRRHGPLELNGTELRQEQACANLLLEEGSLHWAEALFAGPRVAGRVLFLASPSASLLAVLLFQGGRSSRYTWELLEADVLDAAPGCRFLQMLYDPDRADGEGCERSAHERCRAGDLTAKHGP